MIFFIICQLSLNYIRINIFNSVNSHCMQIIQMVKKIHCRFIQIAVYLIICLCLYVMVGHLKFPKSRHHVYRIKIK